MKTHSMAQVGMGLSCVALMACGAAPSVSNEGSVDEPPRELVLLAELGFDDGNTVGFYEGFDGALVLSGAHPVAVARTTLD